MRFAGWDKEETCERAFRRERFGGGRGGEQSERGLKEGCKKFWQETKETKETEEEAKEELAGFV